MKIFLTSFFLGLCLGAQAQIVDLYKKPGKAPKTVQDSLLRHVVLFSFKEATPDQTLRDIEIAFRALPGKIPEIRDFEWGINKSPEGLEQGFTHCFLLTFASEADRAAYLPHPDHKAFGSLLSPWLDKVLVVDYWAKGPD